MAARVLPLVGGIVIFRALQMGDMLCAVPAMRALRGAAPHACITLIGLPCAARFAQRFAAYIDDFLPFPGHPALPEQPVRFDELPAFHTALAVRRPALAIQMHGDGTRTNAIVAGFGSPACAGFHPEGTSLPAGWTGTIWPAAEPETERLLRLTDSLGAPRRGSHLEFPLNAADAAQLHSSGLAEGLAPGAYFCVHLVAPGSDRRRDVERFAALADHVGHAWALMPVFTGEPALARAVAQRMTLPARIAAAPVPIGAMAVLMADARLLACDDTGVSHIAAALRLPSVVASGRPDMRRWVPADAALQRFLWDPQGLRTGELIAHADALLAAAVPAGQRS